ncbi:MAG TPA: site-2 protease family protein, partial [Gaiellaceae bacterium]
MHLAVAIAGLAFLILIHEAGHFVTALAVRMRPRRFYIFFPPAIAKWKRNGIEYGIGSIPLGGYVKIPGMHRPAAGDLDAYLDPARNESSAIAVAAAPVEQALAESRLDDAAAAMPALRETVSSAGLSDPARRAAERGLDDVEDALSADAYWRAPTSKRIAVILAGPATNFVFCIVALAIVFMLGVPSEVSRSVEEVQPGSPAA